MALSYSNGTGGIDLPAPLQPLLPVFQTASARTRGGSRRVEASAPSCLLRLCFFYLSCSWLRPVAAALGPILAWLVALSVSGWWGTGGWGSPPAAAADPRHFGADAPDADPDCGDRRWRLCCTGASSPMYAGLWLVHGDTYTICSLAAGRLAAGVCATRRLSANRWRRASASPKCRTSCATPATQRILGFRNDRAARIFGEDRAALCSSMRA